jgi:pimeloyl-ACP methyl ester carboxylesterase
VTGRKQPLAEERLSEPVEVPALILFGPDDHVCDEAFPDKCEIAFRNCVGPFVVRRAGHFLQWEQPRILNNALIWFLADLRDPRLHPTSPVAS